MGQMYAIHFKCADGCKHWYDDEAYSSVTAVDRHEARYIRVGKKYNNPMWIQSEFVGCGNESDDAPEDCDKHSIIVTKKYRDEGTDDGED